MSLFESELYLQDVQKISELYYDNEKLSGKTVAISGGTGMIGSFLVDVLMCINERYNKNINVYVLGRNEEKAAKRFAKYKNNANYHFLCQDINEEIENTDIKIDYIIHSASNTHPRAYAEDPVGTVSANVIGTNNLLKWASKVSCKRFVFMSSVEIYGENRGDIDKFTEDYLGYIDCNTLRAGYPESKRTGEALTQAYIKQYGMDVVIPRLSRVYGPTILKDDTKAISQFIKKGVNCEDIVLKSEGTQLYSYSYVADAVSATLFIMLEGKCGEAYNVASKDSDLMLKELAEIIAEYAGTKVCYELPDAVEQAGYSKATKATLDCSKLLTLGWKSLFGIKDGLTKTVELLRLDK